MIEKTGMACHKCYSHDLIKKGDAWVCQACGATQHLIKESGIESEKKITEDLIDSEKKLGDQ